MIEHIKIPEIIKKEIDQIKKDYDKNVNNLSLEQERKLNDKIDDILKKLFKTNYSCFIPLDFINSGLGTDLFRIKFGIQYLYNSRDVEVITGLNRSVLYYHIKNGHLDYAIRGGKYVFTEEALYNFMMLRVSKTKGKADYIKAIINAFWKIKTQCDEDGVILSAAKMKKSVHQLVKKPS